MRTGVLVVVMVAQVLLFRSIEGTQFSHAGNAVLWYVTWFIDGMQAWSPLLLLSLGMCLALAMVGVDLSMPAIAALAAAVMSRFAPGNFFEVGVPLAAVAALAAGGVTGTAVRFGGLLPVIATLVAAAVWRSAAWLAVDPAGGAFGIIDGYERLGYFEGAITVTLVLYAAVALIMWFAGRRFLAHGWTVFLIIGVLAFFAGFIHTSLHMGTTAWAMAGMQAPALAAALLAGVEWRSGRPRSANCLLAAFNVILLLRGMETLALQFALSEQTEVMMQYGAIALLIVLLWLGRMVKPRAWRNREAEAEGAAV